MWSSSMLSINGTTVESHAANCDDVSRIQIRTEQTKAGADGLGSAQGSVSAAVQQCFCHRGGAGDADWLILCSEIQIPAQSSEPEQGD
jgi:hypothetical protein